MKEHLLSLSNKIQTLKSKVKSEEATKQAMILPLLDILGYDIFNPEEVMPEIPCDISQAKGDKIDYVLAENGKHQILIECKHWQQNLNNYINQLKKYFVASDARFAILTNGINYLFFSDHDKVNIMDEKPFYSLNLLNLSEEDIIFLSGFRKDAFNANHMIEKSQHIKYRSSILNRIKEEIENPSKKFVDCLLTDIYDGNITDQAYNNFSYIIKDCFKSIITSDKTKEIEVIKDEKKLYEWPEEWSELEKKALGIILGWLEKYEIDEYKIKAKKLSNRKIKITFCN